MATGQLSLEQELGRPTRGHLALAWARLVRKRIALACMAALAVVYLLGIFAPVVSFFAPYGYTEQDYTAIRKPPSISHWAGTDLKGRDVLMRVVWAVQTTVIITVVVVATGGIVLGVTLGLVAGYLGQRVDSIIMRTGELFSAFPDILLIILIAATLGGRIRDMAWWIEDHTFLDGLARSGVADYLVISVALVSFGWIGMARLVRGQVLYLKESQFVDAARAVGTSTPRMLFVHILPNAISPIIVSVSMTMGALVGAEIILSWLGLGVQPPKPSLGTMLLEAGSLSALREVPWMLLAPGAAAWTIVLAWNLLGDSLNDVLNPRTR